MPSTSKLPLEHAWVPIFSGSLRSQVVKAREAIAQLGHRRAELRSRMTVVRARALSLRRSLANEAQGLLAGLTTLRDAQIRLDEARVRIFLA